MRLRILFGTLILVAGLAVYGALAMALAARLPHSALIAFGFYAVAGVAWVPAATLMVRWMQRAAPFRPPPGMEP